MSTYKIHCSMLRKLLKKYIYLLRVQLGAIAVTYHMLLSAIFLADAVVGEQWRIVGFANNFMHYWTLAAWLCVPLLFISPYRRYWLPFAIPACTAFLLWYGVFYVRLLSPPDTRPYTFTAMTYNVGQGRNYRQANAHINSVPAEIVGIQEIANLQVETAAYPYQVSQGDLALLSQYPILADSVRVIGDGPAFRHAVALRARVNIENRWIVIYVVHFVRPTSNLGFLDYDATQRHDGVTVVLDAMTHETDPILMLCDCNFGDVTGDYQRIATVLRDAWEDGARG
ncbi:MAG: hypothetical protein K8S97_13300 [Anaerolineae bacterium]|nr:hypothetical protein [Anaerolineae bacterium]